MNFCVAQTLPVPGDIEANLKRHRELVAHAHALDAHLILFPELSLTGYEPSLAKRLALDAGSSVLDPLQEDSDTYGMAIAVGLPTRSANGTRIGLLVFQPGQNRAIYEKRFLHADEESVFEPGDAASPIIEIAGHKAFAAICYEISIREHTQKARELGADLILGSVAKTASGTDLARDQLAKLAKQCKAVTLFANCVGKADGQRCGGKSSIWHGKGTELGCLDDTTEGLLVYHSQTGHVATLNPSRA